MIFPILTFELTLLLGACALRTAALLFLLV